MAMRKGRVVEEGLDDEKARLCGTETSLFEKTIAPALGIDWQRPGGCLLFDNT
jgi:hypothetical protein